MELTIAMLISAISIAMAFYMLQYFQQLFLQQQKQRQERFSFSLFKHLIGQDIDKADWIKTVENGIVCEGKNGSISYLFDPVFIVREQYTAQKDTFFIQTVDLDLSPQLQHLPIPQITDHIYLKVKFNHQDHQLIYHKTYSAKQLMQTEALANN